MVVPITFQCLEVLHSSADAGCRESRCGDVFTLARESRGMVVVVAVVVPITFQFLEVLDLLLVAGGIVATRSTCCCVVLLLSGHESRGDPLYHQHQEVLHFLMVLLRTVVVGTALLWGQTRKETTLNISARRVSAC